LKKEKREEEKDVKIKRKKANFLVREEETALIKICQKYPVVTRIRRLTLILEDLRVRVQER